MLNLTYDVNSNDSKIETIKIGINVWPGYSHAFIAQEMGFFEKNNVDVELILDKEYSETQNLYLNGKVDGVFEVFSDSIFHNFEGVDTKIVYVADYSTSGDVIVGIGNSLSELKGKKIGVEGFNSFSHIFVLKALENAGLTEKDVEFVSVPAHNVLLYLEDGKIHAGHTWEPTKSNAIKKNYKVLAEAGEIPGIITDVLAFNKKIIQERPEDIKSIVKSILEARDFIQTNRDEAISIMAEQTGMSFEEMEKGVMGVYHPNLEENVNTMVNSEDSTSLLTTGRFIANFYWERGQINKIPDFDEMIEPTFIMQIAANT